MCVSITTTYHTILNMSTINNIRLKVLLWGDNNTNIYYIILYYIILYYIILYYIILYYIILYYIILYYNIIYYIILYYIILYYIILYYIILYYIILYYISKSSAAGSIFDSAGYFPKFTVRTGGSRVTSQVDFNENLAVK